MTTTWLESTPPDLEEQPARLPAASLLDRFMPAWDATRVEHRVILAPLERVYTAALDADVLDAIREHRLVRILIAIRRGFERVVTALRGRPWVEPSPPPALRLRDVPSHGEWIRLGEEAPHEIAFGAIGRFWGGETKWETIDQREFATFSRPGFARVGCNLLLHDLGDGAVLLSYAARTRATDAASQRAFLRYWRVTSPFIGVVMRALLTVIERDVARGTRLR
ncbi:MAG TPA: hypothetical protein VLE53_15140 [Gemmatimonadaceae bacterium]|nr:hypothetical protein [Gemmatimonadaceae bacterium]